MDAAPDLLEALQYIIKDIDPQEYCRGKYKTMDENKAYVGSKKMPTDEAIVRCIEAINKKISLNNN